MTRFNFLLKNSGLIITILSVIFIVADFLELGDSRVMNVIGTIHIVMMIFMTAIICVVVVREQ